MLSPAGSRRPRGFAFAGRSGSRCRGYRFFARLFGDGEEILAQSFGRDQLQLFTDVANEARQLITGKQRQQREASANLCGVVFDRGNGPCFGEHFDQEGTKGWAARIAVLQAVETALQFRCKAGAIDAVLLQDEGNVVVGTVDCLQQIVLDLNVVVGARKAESRCGLQGTASCIVQFADQRLQVQAHLSCSRGMTATTRTTGLGQPVSCLVRITLQRPVFYPAHQAEA